MFNPEETQYEVLRRRGICRRDFLKFCSMAAVALGLGPMGHLEIAHAMETKPYLPVLWIDQDIVGSKGVGRKKGGITYKNGGHDTSFGRNRRPG